MTMRPDPTFHASPTLAMKAAPENFVYTLLLSPDFSKPDALAVIDVKPGSPKFSQVVHTVSMPHNGDEFHHFGWNACSSALSPLSGHTFLERRYLIIPGLRSSRIYVVDTKPHPTQAKIHKVIEPEEVFKKTGYSRPHTVHCGPEGIYVSTLGGGGRDGTDGPPGIFIMDCQTFDILGRWEIDRGPQNLHYDFWWNLPRDYTVTSEWALPPQFENGIVPEDLLSNKYGHRLHFWDLRARRNVQTIDLGANHQMALLAVVASGFYHGINPGMGWPLAVSAGLMERNGRAVLSALRPLTVGHVLAIFVVILPFSLLAAVVQWQPLIQLGASLLITGFGFFRFFNRRHPRVLARIPPKQLGLWSFAVAYAHGAGMMLVPVYLGLCRGAGLNRAHAAAGALIDTNLGMAVMVSMVHAFAMLAAGGLLAWLVYRYLGLRVLSRSWFNLDTIWAISLIFVGAVSLIICLVA